ncbi:Rha family transcriptional regulator [Burkholderia sp. MBR-1]|nr:Rha family transcriptional regulator [Burkholderia sp. MBR-1]MBR8217734.1 Rha family transcriptional regulator [Burkholderia vietnamiensis]
MTALMSLNPSPILSGLMMSSREIADLVESRHDNVKVTIERLVSRGVIASPAMQEKATAGRPVVEYLVGKRDSYVIVAQLSPAFTARLVDRWQELEAAEAKAPQPGVSSGSLQLARHMLDALEHQAHELALARAEQAQQAVQLQAIERRVDDLGRRSALVTVLDERPAGTESLTRATERAWATFGLPTEIAKFALTESAHQIAPLHEVKNKHVANAPPYKVYQRAQVTVAIRKFISECHLVSSCVAEHWAYAAPFRINPTVFRIPRTA